MSRLTEGHFALDVLSALDGAQAHSFAFAIDNVGEDGRRGDLRATTPFGSPHLGAKIELTRHPLSLIPDGPLPRAAADPLIRP